MAGENAGRLPFITERDELDDGDAENFDIILESRGRISLPFQLLLNSPDVAGRIAQLGTYIKQDSQLDETERQLAIITTAREFECRVEWLGHKPQAIEAGVSEAAVQVVAEQTGTEHLLDVEELVIRFCRELFGRNEVPDALFERANARFGNRGVLDLMATMGYYGMVASILNGLDVDSEIEGKDVPEW